MNNNRIKVIISGGGTGGHIFPALSIANALVKLSPDIDILFVGAEGRMEMTRVPDAGYKIIGLPVAGFDRKNFFRNIPILFKLFSSMLKAYKIVGEFKPDAAVGVGGYVSGPLLMIAGLRGVPSLVQEQNSYAGVTNKLLARTAKKFCVAYDGMERFFPKEKIIKTGNPIRQNLLEHYDKDKARETFGLDPKKKTILVLGGSLGARTINRSILNNIEKIVATKEVQLIWQTGKFYIESIKESLKEKLGKEVEDMHIEGISNIYVSDFITNMAEAYAAADLVVSRAGAGSISEFSLLAKPVILVPSPNVSEDHQTKNAMALVEKQAAIYVKDGDAELALVDRMLETIGDEACLDRLSRNIQTMAYKDSAEVIAKEILKLIENNKK